MQSGFPRGSEEETVYIHGATAWSCLKLQLHWRRGLLSAFSTGSSRVLGCPPSCRPVPFTHGFSPCAILDSEWTWEVSTLKKMASWGNRFEQMRENDSLKEYNLWMDACSKARQALLAMTFIHFLCLFFFKGKEKLKSPWRIGRWMCQHRGGERSVWDCPRIPGEGAVTAVGSQSWPPVLAGSLRRHARPALAPQPAPSSARPSWPHTEL